MRYRRLRETLCRCSPTLAQRLFFRYEMGRFPNLDEPRTFNEKLSYIMLYELPHCELASAAADKYAFRPLVEALGFGEYLLPLLGVWDRAQDVDFDALPQSFIVKCNHGCDFNIPCFDKESFDVAAARKKLDTWMGIDWALLSAELHYSGIERKIIAEPLVGAGDGPCCDYKFYCIGGEPVFFAVVKDGIKTSADARDKRISFYNVDGSLAEFQRSDYQRIPEGEVPDAGLAARLARASGAMAGALPFEILRVDFLVHGDEAYLLELTLTPTAGRMPFEPEEWDRKLGDMVKLPGESLKGTVPFNDFTS